MENKFSVFISSASPLKKLIKEPQRGRKTKTKPASGTKCEM